MPTLEEMRAEINRLLPTIETPQFVKNIQTAYENMPGSQLVRPIAETAATLGTGIASLIPSTLYGVGKGIQAGEFGTSTKTAQQEAMNAMRAMTYQPRTEAGKSMVESIESIPRTLTGSHMGIGMLPELMVMPPRISPSDVQVLGARGINTAREIADIPRDFSAAQSGLTRIGAYNQPTYGARLQSVAEDIGDVMARRQARRSEDDSPILSGLETFMPETNLYAVKPKGGNWPTTLGSTLPLEEQGMMGRRLSRVSKDESKIPELFEDELARYDKRNNTRLRREFIREYQNDVDENIVDTINRFIYDKNVELSDQDLPLLPTLDVFKKVLPPYNQWVMGPYQKYIQNQMGTGLPTDPLLNVVNQADIPLTELFPSVTQGSYINPEFAESKRQMAAERSSQIPGADLSQPPYQNVGKVTATTEAGKQLENALDTDINIRSKYGYGVEKYPFAKKLDPDSVVYDVNFSAPESVTGLPDIQNYVLEGLLSGKYDINKVSNLPPHVVVQDMVKDYQNRLKAEQKNKELMETYRHERAKQLQVDTAFPDGSRMVVFNKASYDADPIMLKRDFGQITKDLNQCIGAGCHGTPEYPGHGPALEPHTGRPPRGSTGELGYKSYYDMVKDGRGEIVSFLDPNDKYQFTIQLKYERQALTSDEEKTIAESWLTQNAPETLPKFLNIVEERGNGPAIAAALKSFPQIKDAIISSQFTKKDITQMRGADNGNAPEMYEYLIIDWLNKNADQLGDISDLEMIPNIIDLNRRSAYITDRLSEYEPDWDLDTLKDFVEQIKEEKALPRFFDGSDISYLAEKRKVDLTESPPKELNEFDRKVVLQEFDNHILGKPDSLYDQDNLQEKFIKDINLLRGYPIKYDLPIDIHRKIAKMILSDDQSLVNSVATQIRNYINDGNRYGEDDLPIFGLTGRQISSVHNILNNWYNRHPRKENPIIWELYPDDVQKHPNPFDEIKLKEEFSRTLLPTVLKIKIDSYLETGIRDPRGQINEDFDIDFDILMGDQSPEAKLPKNIHSRIANALIDQDDFTTQIRNSINRLVAGEDIYGLNAAQRANVYNILTQWVERYPLND